MSSLTLLITSHGLSTTKETVCSMVCSLFLLTVKIPLKFISINKIGYVQYEKEYLIRTGRRERPADKLYYRP